MATIRYFCTGGYTENEGIDFFLRKINPRVNWKREFPAISKRSRRGRPERRETYIRLREQKCLSYALLASPEIEAWLLSDGDNSILKEYVAYFSHWFKNRLSAEMGRSFPWTNVESFGTPLQNSSCTVKLSTVIQAVFKDLPFMSQFVHNPDVLISKLQYSKREKGLLC